MAPRFAFVTNADSIGVVVRRESVLGERVEDVGGITTGKRAIQRSERVQRRERIIHLLPLAQPGDVFLIYHLFFYLLNFP